MKSPTISVWIKLQQMPIETRGNIRHWVRKVFFLANEIDRIYNDYTVIKTRPNLSCVFIYLYVSTFVCLYNTVTVR